MSVYFFLDATRDLLTLYVVSFGSTVFGIIVIIFGISYYPSWTHSALHKPLRW